MTKIRSVVVVGCGPAGLAAAHAAAGLGYPVRVIAPKAKTPQRGPLLLQRPIPGITADHPDGYIRQIVLGGGILDYSRFLYGDINIGINGDVLAEGYHAWRFPQVYDKLWDRYSDLIEDRAVTPLEIREESAGDSVLWVSTAPLHRMCMVPTIHRFRSAMVEIAQHAEFENQPDDTIVFNAGMPGISWSRSSRIFGVEVTEWPCGHTSSGKILETRLIDKPISHDCTCFPRALLTGRFGAWRNETWVDTAYYDVRTALISSERAQIWAGVTGQGNGKGIGR